MNNTPHRFQTNDERRTVNLLDGICSRAPHCYRRRTGISWKLAAHFSFTTTKIQHFSCNLNIHHNILTDTFSNSDHRSLAISKCESFKIFAVLKHFMYHMPLLSGLLRYVSRRKIVHNILLSVHFLISCA